ncbi:MAG TPA: metallophosphoesterase [Gemmataceae bacterium]|nr:metallophosphoesterase [Gemmataceae bacterium]
MPDPDRLLRTLYKAADAVRQTPGRKGRFVQIHDVEEVLVAGDLHGHLGNFQAVYKLADLANHPRRHLVLQEAIHGKTRYPGGGDKSHQLVDLFAALKCQLPRQVHLLMGNHELAQWTNRMIIKDEKDLNALFREGVTEAYGAEKAPQIYDAYLRLFGLLPLGLRTPNRVFISHSLPREKAVDRFELRHLETDSFPAEDLTLGGSVYELVWGRDTRAETCAAFLKKVDCDWLVSGHVACEGGYANPNPRQIILDCCDNPAAYALLPADRPLTAEEFTGSVRVLEPVG